ncbi:molybdenum hydroxylase accessory protein%2C YgfJ family [Bordetella ansorpii]|uniref:Molybdenum hydroxylase accessory protein, YgfJ family n=1 Tax=Bordetella ansorpii TaxID=288768 RepID=A0A157SAC4_9BORD|nr:nucleotidyltransferase family protein [Bordetella ansorpii]SAI67372.1 molybdenum hydroxylase accessory protein%2C YgfJ family [Bordetella ansorpii]
MRVDDCVGILLAGGFGRRYAAQAPGMDKLLARLPDGRPVAVAAAQALLAVLPRVHAVVRPEGAELARLLAAEGCRVLRDEAARQGMGASLAAAASALLREYPPNPAPQADAVASGEPRPDRCLVALGDMPWLRPATILHLAQHSRGHLIAAPEFQARRGHPVAFAAALWPELARLAGDTGAREVLHRHGVKRLAVDDPGILADVDLPTDLRPGA